MVRVSARTEKRKKDVRTFFPPILTRYSGYDIAFRRAVHDSGMFRKPEASCNNSSDLKPSVVLMLRNNSSSFGYTVS